MEAIRFGIRLAEIELQGTEYQNASAGAPRLLKFYRSLMT
jgi:hypothetical protein